MSSLYDPEMIRRLMAPPEGSEPPGVAKGSRRAQPQARQMPPPPQAGATYGGQEALPPLPPMIKQAMDAQQVEGQRLGQLFRDTAPGVSPAESRLQELAGGLQPLRGMSGPTPTWSPPGSSYFVPGEPPDYKYLADSAKYSRDEAAKQDQRNAGLMAGRNTPAALQALAQTESAKIAASSNNDRKRIAESAYLTRYNNHLSLRPNDPEGAAAEGRIAYDAVMQGAWTPQPGGQLPGPPPSPSGEFQPPAGMPAAPPPANPTPSAVTTALNTYNVIPKAGAQGAVASDINAKALAEMLMGENALRNQYPELARQALTSGLGEGNVTLPTARQIIAYHNAATRDAPEGAYGPYKIRRTATPFTPAEPYQGEQVAGHGGSTTGYTITGPGMEGGIWHSRGSLFSDPLSGPWFATDKTRAEAGEKASLLANVLQQMMVQKARMAPPQNAAPPK